jgi:coiled-coil domain-containing protein 64
MSNQMLEQEKHGLRRKLDTLEGEYESRVLELQTDLEQVRHKLIEQQGSLRQTELEKGRLLQELIEQNHRLTAELKQVSISSETKAKERERETIGLTGDTHLQSRLKVICTC